MAERFDVSTRCREGLLAKPRGIREIETLQSADASVPRCRLQLP